MQDQVFTIGHSTLSIESFVGALRQHGVTAVADVRSAPYSRFNPQFNRESLADALRQAGIKYVFLGHELGARSKDPSCYENGRVRYRSLARTSTFQEGIDRVVRGAREYRIALMCAEKEPLECHRTLLVARVLAERDVAIKHILSDGRVESHEATMQRLLDAVHLPHADLFRSSQELIAEALVRQEERIAYVDEEFAADAANRTG